MLEGGAHLNVGKAGACEHRLHRGSVEVQSVARDVEVEPGPAEAAALPAAEVGNADDHDPTVMQRPQHAMQIGEGICHVLERLAEDHGVVVLRLKGYLGESPARASRPLCRATAHASGEGSTPVTDQPRRMNQLPRSPRPQPTSSRRPAGNSVRRISGTVRSACHDCKRWIAPDRSLSTPAGSS